MIGSYLVNDTHKAVQFFILQTQAKYNLIAILIHPTKNSFVWAKHENFARFLA